MSQLGFLAGSAGRFVLDALLPPRCLSCREEVADPGRLCPACWTRLSFLQAPCCVCCGHPFDQDPGAPLFCATCAAARPPFRRARAALRYDEGSRDLILGFKHADRTEAAPAFARWMARAGAELIEDCDLLAPVPLHWLRLLGRRYNQAALLSAAIASQARIRHAPDLLRRRRPGPGQGRLGRRERHLAVRRVFAVRPAWQAHLTGRTVLLIDDVLTTGATAAACAEALFEAGAAQVDVLTLARVVRAA